MSIAGSTIIRSPLLPKLLSNDFHIAIERLAHNLAVFTDHHGHPRNREGTTRGGKTGKIPSMGASRHPLDRDLVPMHDTVSHLNLQIGKATISAPMRAAIAARPTKGS